VAERGEGPGLRTLAAMGSTIVVSVLTGLGLGWLADRAAGTTPLFIFVGLGFGIVTAALGAYRVLRSFL
jgi:F0F1-type ATP synthase assembly protein I